MNFCENCNFVSENEYCPVCGSKKLRKVKDDDFCFLADSKMSPCETRIGIFDEKKIPYSQVPYGMGSRWAMPLLQYRLYVPYHSLEWAKGVIHEIENAETERLRKILLENQNKFNIAPKKEKKIVKKLKLSLEQDFCSYCVNIVTSAKKIVSESMTGGGGYYIYCYTENEVITFNSQTFEILSLSKC